MFCLEESVLAVLEEAAREGRSLRRNDIAKALGLEGFSGEPSKSPDSLVVKDILWELERKDIAAEVGEYSSWVLLDKELDLRRD